MKFQKALFKYNPYAATNGVLKRGDVVCDCCSKKTNLFYDRQDDIDALCTDCISSGEAAKKFNIQFVYDTDFLDTKDIEKDNELFYRTPSYESWQEPLWLTCCDDYCAFLGDVGTKELEQMGILDEVFEDYEEREPTDDVEWIKDYLTKTGECCGVLVSMFALRRISFTC